VKEVPSLEDGFTFWNENCWITSNMWKIKVKPGTEHMAHGADEKHSFKPQQAFF
jgi:hypothetical protein